VRISKNQNITSASRVVIWGSVPAPPAACRAAASRLARSLSNQANASARLASGWVGASIRQDAAGGEGLQQAVGQVRGRQIAVEHAAERHIPPDLGLVPAGALASEQQQQQVVHAIAARQRALQQLRVDQALQCPLGGRGRGIQQRGRCPQAYLRSLVQPEQPEQSRGRLLAIVSGVPQRLVADLEAGADRQVAGLQLVQAGALVGEPVGQRAHRPARARGKARARDPQRQRQAAALPDHLRRLSFGGQPLGARPPSEQAHRLLGREHLQVQVARPVQGREGLPAGDQRGAGRAGRQQRPDLCGRDRVVEHQHDASPSEQ
jgi:hypothetical protein